MAKSIPELPDLNQVTWHPAETAPEDVVQRLGSCRPAGRLRVKHNRRRSVYRFVPSAGPSLFLKHDHPSNPRDLLKGLWRLKAEREFKSAQALVDAGIATAEPVAWGRKGVDTFLVTAEIPDIEEFLPAWQAVSDKADERTSFIDTLSDFLAGLIEAGVHHPDMHAGNVVVHQAETGPVFYLRDVYGVSISSTMGSSRVFSMLYWLNGWARGLSCAEVERFLAPIATAAGIAGAASVWKLLLAGARKASASRWRGLRHRLLHNGSIYTGHAIQGGKWLVKNGTELSLAAGAVERHHEMSTAGTLLKDDTKRRLSRVNVGGISLVVKEYLRPRGWGRLRSDTRGWLGACRLYREGFEVAEPLAWLRGDDGHGYIILGDVGPENLPNAPGGSA